MPGVTVNQRRYRMPRDPVVVVCLDGCAPAYLEHAEQAGLLPCLARLRRQGTFALVQGNMPSYTNPNNVSIVTGVRPDVHGISGNHFLDPKGVQVQMTDPAFLRCPTLLSALSGAGLQVSCVTAKEKLRRLVGSGLSGCSLSGERIAEAAADDPLVQRLLQRAGAAPGIYSGALSAYVLQLGLQLLELASPDVLYLSLTDYVPHKHPPGSAAANRFFGELDHWLGQLLGFGVLLGITADHGMNDKTDQQGAPRVVYLEQVLECGVRSAERRAGRGGRGFEVVLPITDPYVAHHGSLGSFACVYLEGMPRRKAVELLTACDGVEAVLTRKQAAAQLHLPADRVGDLVVLGDRRTVLGRSPEHHDLSRLDRPLRSHGGLHERTVPLYLNRQLDAAGAAELPRAGNHDLFHLLLNRCQSSLTGAI